MIKKGSATAVIVLLVAACSNAAPPTTTIAAAPPTTSTTVVSPPTTTVPPPASTTPPSTTPPATTVSTGTVGSPQALEALIDRVVAEVGAENLGGRDNVPLLDINNPDPVAALQSIIAFDSWLATTWPDPPMVEPYTYDGSPGRVLYAQGASATFKGGSRIVYLGDPYVAMNYQIVDPTAVLPPDVIDDLPGGSVSITYNSSSGPYEVRRVEDERVDATSSGWSSRAVVTVLAPSSFGWQIWFEVTP